MTRPVIKTKTREPHSYGVENQGYRWPIGSKVGPRDKSSRREAPPLVNALVLARLGSDSEANSKRIHQSIHFLVAGAMPAQWASFGLGPYD